ncbi:TetR/AcrR family transcriptional regulator [Streptomyces griseus]|uniref:TetR family transcriptional regulator n=1 Tax=Streptomyces griseus TaxID=1911 RepID=UPI0013B990D5|nr:TetR/AcrR family transcriptional regulator [Streptomyces griseus]
MKERGEAGDRREEMVRRLVEAAGIVIDRNGYAAASTPEIVRQAGASRGALYHHFQSKRQLGDAVLDCQRRFFEQVSEQAWAGPAPQVWLQTLIDISHYYTAGILDDPVLRAAVRLSIEPGPYQSAESYAAPLGAVTAVLESARVADELQDYVQPAEAARTLVGCYSGIQLLALALAEGDGLHAQVTAMWRMCMPGIARKNILTRLRLGPPGSGRPSLPGARP